MSKKINLNKNYIYISLFLILLIFTILIIKSPSTFERITSIFTLRGHSSNSFRVNVWLSCLNIFLKITFL
ncbi:MAG: hypothetical protein KatS3mg068_2301 [Candidatus Sericytochromatia bacterium]|nr:MAG: hypothetical protein KatS3mg068_2301 [Candidatus Sericytochromatia bacterium]